MDDKGQPETMQTPSDGEMLMPICSNPGCFFYRLSVLARLTNSSIVWLVSQDSQPPELFGMHDALPIKDFCLSLVTDKKIKGGRGKR